MKKLKYLFTFVLVLLISSNTVLANNNDHIVDFDRNASITITLREQDENTPINGAEITIYQVATATNKNNNLSFIYNEKLQICDLDLSNNNLAKQIDKCIKEVELPSQKELTNEEGIVEFNKLPLGLYLVKQTNEVYEYSTIDPFLIATPKEEDNRWVYDIEATPKTEIIKLVDIIVEKKWDIINSNDNKENVTIELYKGDELIDTVILNDENNWTHTWKQIKASDEYSVKEINIPIGYTPTYRQVANKFIVTNTKTLVNTGQNTWLVSLLAYSGLIFVGVGFVLLKRNSYE